MPIATTSPVETLRDRVPPSCTAWRPTSWTVRYGGGQPVGDRVAVPHDAAGRLQHADEEHQTGVLDQLAGVAVGNAQVDRAPDHGGHHGLRAHPRDAEEHAHHERAPLALPEPPQQPARRPVVSDAGVMKGQDAHLSTLGRRRSRSERFSAGWRGGAVGVLVRWLRSRAARRGVSKPLDRVRSPGSVVEEPSRQARRLETTGSGGGVLVRWLRSRAARRGVSKPLVRVQRSLLNDRGCRVSSVPVKQQRPGTFAGGVPVKVPGRRRTAGPAGRRSRRLPPPEPGRRRSSRWRGAWRPRPPPR